jgi:hypothetical protein
MQIRLLILLLLVFSSCESIFHDDDNQYLVIDTQQEKVDILNGIYSRLVKVHDYDYFKTFVRSDDINIYTNYAYSYTFENSSGYCSASGESFDFSGITDNIYLNLYSAIVSANRLLLTLSDTEDPEIMGELYFLRAYCYFKLARLFGIPPLVTDIEVNYLTEKPSYQELYEFIEGDMLKALELLPDSYTDARIPGETPNKGTAKAMLAEIYLSMAGFPVNDETKYVEAARLAGEVIEQAEQYNYALLGDLANLWKNEYRHNTETIFGLYFNSDGVGTQNTIGGSGLASTFDDELDIRGGYHPEFKFFKTFPNNYRKYNSFVTGYYQQFGYDTLNGYAPGMEFELYDPLVNPCDFIYYVVSLKWLDREAYYREDASWISRSKVTLYLLRYAQTLLTYAEAKARSGNLDESCFEAVNRIRRRANNVDIYTPSEFDLPFNLTAEQFLDSVVWERAWELCTEPEGRWFDIVRLNLKDKLADYRYPQDAPTVIDESYLNEDWYFYRIPQEDRWLNPNFNDSE